MDSEHRAYDVTADTLTNTLYLSVSERLGDDTRERFVVEALTSATFLDEGFAVITDVSTFDRAPESVTSDFSEARDRFEEMGVGPMVDVVSDTATGKSGGRIPRVASVDEAERMLAADR